MTAFVAIPNGDIDQDSPVTQELLTALRDNLLAVAEGDATAPKILPPALDLFLASGAINSTGTTFTGLNCQAVMLMITSTQSVTTGYNWQVRFSSDGGATFGSWQSIWTPGGQASPSYSAAHIYLDIGATPEFIQAMGEAKLSAEQPYNTLTHPGGTINAIGVRTSNSGMSGAVKIFGIGTEQ